MAQVVPARAVDRAQTLVNGGTGLGVLLLFAPIALLLLGQWRAAWGVYAIVSAMVTIWLLRADSLLDAPTRRQ